MKDNKLEQLIKESGSLAQLLADKEKCMACGLTWRDVRTAFFQLWKHGEQQCIDYIIKTML